MSSPYRDRPWPKVKVERAFIDAVIAGDFPTAEALFDRLPFKDREIPSERVPRKDLTRAGVQLLWRPSFMDCILTWWGTEGIKGPWTARVREHTVFFAFDEEVAIAPDFSDDERDILRRLSLF